MSPANEYSRHRCAVGARLCQYGGGPRSRAIGAHPGLTPRRYQSGEMDRTGRISNAGKARIALARKLSVILLAFGGQEMRSTGPASRRRPDGTFVGIRPGAAGAGWLPDGARVRADRDSGPWAVWISREPAMDIAAPVLRTRCRGECFRPPREP
jgi:hypothetical protein